MHQKRRHSTRTTENPDFICIWQKLRSGKHSYASPYRHTHLCTPGVILLKVGWLIRLRASPLNTHTHTHKDICPSSFVSMVSHRCRCKPRHWIVNPENPHNSRLLVSQTWLSAGRLFWEIYTKRMITVECATSMTHPGFLSKRKHQV